MARQQRIQSSPFLPSLPAIAAGDLGKVVFPGTTQAGRGKLSLEDRLPLSPQNTKQIDGPSSYTRPPTDTREGGQYPPRFIGRPARLYI